LPHDGQGRGVYIQDVVLPDELVQVLTQREIAHQERDTYTQQRIAQEGRVQLEAERGRADMQHDLAGSEVGMQIAPNRSSARKSKADGEAAFIRETGTARGAEVRAVGLARAEGYEAQRRALGEAATAVIQLDRRTLARAAVRPGDSCYRRGESF